jgi:hypothetical protein
MARSPNAFLDAEGVIEVAGSASTVLFSFSCCGCLLGAEPRSWFVDASGLMSSFRCQPTWFVHSSRTPRSSGGFSSSTSFSKAMPSSSDSIMIGLWNLAKSFFEACCAFIHYINAVAGSVADDRVSRLMFSFLHVCMSDDRRHGNSAKIETGREAGENESTA